MDHEKPWVALKEMDMPRHLIIQGIFLYCGQEAMVRTDYGETELFPTGKDVRQGCILYPNWFNL